MKKISALAAFTMAALALATPAHADAYTHADDGDRGRITVAGYPLTTANLCREALALIPVVTPGTGTAVDDACNNREHVHDSRDQAAGAAR
ncbi:hypothetical protein [Streptomyces bicolor]|uniref:hypothetical protein n=1 Tax=Streptomyces bicolor TaxID=66874 RepID=UPI0004E0D5FA|nr:hypothetical protein [Streptomyces bicolor]